MKLAVVINAEHGTEALGHALYVQTLFLDHMGSRLDSIRLAAPRLLRHACASAIAEGPDALVVVGGPRSARQAGQLAHEKNIPIVFLPGFRSPAWASRLWGALPLEDMIDRLAREDVSPVRLDAAKAGDRIFFESAEWGFLAHIRELRRAIDETEDFSEELKVATRAGGLLRNLMGPGTHFHADGSRQQRATALIVRTKDHFVAAESREGEPAFHCTAYRYGPLGYARALVRGVFGGEWRSKRYAENLECKTLVLEARPRTWLLLDQEPVRFDHAINFHFTPAAIQTFSFQAAKKVGSDNGKSRRPAASSFAAAADLWNVSSSSHVAVPESRKGGDWRNRKQV